MTLFGGKVCCVSFNNMVFKVIIFKLSKACMQMLSFLSSLMAISQSFSTDTGVKQGCDLSPKLFNLFINDISSIFFMLLVTLCL